MPWSRLGQVPVVVEFDRIYVLAEPLADSPEAEPDAKVSILLLGIYS